MSSLTQHSVVIESLVMLMLMLFLTRGQSTNDYCEIFPFLLNLTDYISNTAQNKSMW